MDANMPAGDLHLTRRQIGNTDVRVSRLALGGFHQVEMSAEIVQSTVDTFLNAGGNYIETARGYGRGASERKIGRAIQGRRDHVVLASKSSARDADGLCRDLDASLESLGTDHLEFYFLHGVNTYEDFELILSKGGALGSLLHAIDTGVIKGIGFSSHRPGMYLRALENLPISLILIWHNYLEDQYLPEIVQSIFPKAREANVAVTVMKPLADGFLYQSPERAIRYCLRADPEVIVCGMNCPSHVNEAVDAINRGPLSDAEHADLLLTAPELGNYVCRQCGACSPELMRLFRLEGYVDRQMLDYLPHNPASYALRTRLAGWFSLATEAREAAGDFDMKSLEKQAASATCPYGIDVQRKARIAWAKVAGERPELV